MTVGRYEWLFTPPKRTKLIASTDRQRTTHTGHHNGVRISGNTIGVIAI